MSDVGLDGIGEVIIILLLSIGTSILILIYHIIKAFRESRKKQISIIQTKSFGYILGGILIIGIVWLLSIIDGDLIGKVLLLSPISILLFGYIYNTVKK